MGCIELHVLVVVVRLLKRHYVTNELWLEDLGRRRVEHSLCGGGCIGPHSIPRCVRVAINAAAHTSAHGEVGEIAPGFPRSSLNLCEGPFDQFGCCARLKQNAVGYPSCKAERLRPRRRDVDRYGTGWPAKTDLGAIPCCRLPSQQCAQRMDSFFHPRQCRWPKAYSSYRALSAAQRDNYAPRCELGECCVRPSEDRDMARYRIRNASREKQALCSPSNCA